MQQVTVRLADLAMPAELAEAFGVASSTVANWAQRDEHFPDPVLSLAMGRVYDMTAVTRWYGVAQDSPWRQVKLVARGLADAQLPRPYPGRVAAGAGDQEYWPVGDLTGARELVSKYGISKGLLNMWCQRRETSGFPAPVLSFAMGPLFSISQVARWWSAYEQTPSAKRVLARAAARNLAALR